MKEMRSAVRKFDQARLAMPLVAESPYDAFTQFIGLPGRRPTRPGRALVRTHQSALMAVEGVVNEHYRAWKHREPTPVAAAMDVMYARWIALPKEGRLVLEWPVHRLRVEPTLRRTSRR